MESTYETIKIRPLIPEDKDCVNAFFRGLGEEGTYFFNRHGGNERGTYEYMNGEKPRRIYWVAVADTSEGEEIAGLVFLFNTDTKVPWLGIGVSEKWKGRRIGGSLMERAREWAESVGAGGIMLSTAPENTRAQRLYERMGYVNIGTQENGELLYLLAFANERVK